MPSLSLWTQKGQGLCQGMHNLKQCFLSERQSNDSFWLYSIIVSHFQYRQEVFDSISSITHLCNYEPWFQAHINKCCHHLFIFMTFCFSCFRVPLSKPDSMSGSFPYSVLLIDQKLSSQAFESATFSTFTCRFMKPNLTCLV